MALKFPDKDPDEKLDYTVDWSRYLGTDNLIINSVVWKIQKADGSFTPFTEGYSFENDALSVNVGTGENEGDTVGLTNNLLPTPTDTTTTIVLSKGEANTNYVLLCEITTSASSKTTDAIITNRKITIRVRERV